MLVAYTSNTLFILHIFGGGLSIPRFYNWVSGYSWSWNIVHGAFFGDTNIGINRRTHVQLQWIMDELTCR